MNSEQQAVRAFVEQILHGDEDHRAWLREAAEAFVNGDPMPEPRGGGRKEKEIERLEAENAQKEKALRDIVNVRDVEGWGLETARGIARQALKESLGSAITCTINALIRWKQDDD